jgi:hypothetical protein
MPLGKVRFLVIYLYFRILFPYHVIGDGVSSGLIGLAYPGLTSVFNGTDPDDDSLSNLDEYDPFFFTAVKEGAVSEPRKLPVSR